MKLILAGIAVAVTRLALGSIVLAQIVDADDRPTPPPRLEVGPAAGLFVAFPESGGLVSVPLDGQSAIEIVVAHLWQTAYAPAHSLVQLQVRRPFREDLRSRKSLVIGLSRVHAYLPGKGFLGRDAPEFVRPHAGVSLQWPIGRHVDFRFDAQGLFTFASTLPMVPRATTTFVWHR